jgi:hypothetical protein
MARLPVLGCVNTPALLHKVNVFPTSIEYFSFSSTRLAAKLSNLIITRTIKELKAEVNKGYGFSGGKSITSA